MKNLSREQNTFRAGDVVRYIGRLHNYQCLGVVLRVAYYGCDVAWYDQDGMKYQTHGFEYLVLVDDDEEAAMVALDRLGKGEND
jgi:hypothetical protein